MSEMSQAQQPASGGMEVNPTDDMVPPGSPRDPDSPRNQSEFDGREDVLPQDHGAEDVAPQDRADINEPAHPAGVPMPRTGEEGAPPAQSSSDPMPDIAGQTPPE
ncbi:MAG TPA: hypothetical protein VI094_12255 [Propionibacteriaceae bacterium]